MWHTLKPALRLCFPAMAIVALASCGGAADSSPEEEPVIVEEIAGSEVWKLTLSASAADRLDVQTGQIESNGDGYLVSRAAVIIDPTGGYWVYTNPEPLVYVREQLEDVYEDGDLAFFADGPAAGTSVVTVGVPELWGAEFGIGK